MMKNGQYIAIVDPFIGTESIRALFQPYHIECIAILSDQYTTEQIDNMIDNGRYVPSEYAKHIALAGDFNALVEQLTHLDLMAIIPGIEISMVLVDRLNHALKLPYSNPINSSISRFNKYFTSETLKTQHIRAVKQVRLTLEDIKNDCVDFNSIPAPFVIKPTQSAGSFGVHICQSQQEATQLLKAIAQHKDDFTNQTHVEFCLQEQLVGEEYIVDIVNFSAKQYIAGIQLYNKQCINGQPIYQSFSQVDPHSDKAKTVINYACEVMLATEFHFGAAHVEIFLTEDGPKLVEINPRFSGARGYHNKLSQLTTDRHQLSLLAALYTGQTQMDQLPKTSDLSGEVFCLCNLSQQGPINQQALDTIASLPAFQAMFIYPKTVFPVTTNLHSQVGFVLLAHTDKAQLNADHQRLLDIQKHDLFSSI